MATASSPTRAHEFLFLMAFCPQQCGNLAVYCLAAASALPSPRRIRAGRHTGHLAQYLSASPCPRVGGSMQATVASMHHTATSCSTSHISSVAAGGKRGFSKAVVHAAAAKVMLPIVPLLFRRRQRRNGVCALQPDRLSPFLHAPRMSWYGVSQIVAQSPGDRVYGFQYRSKALAAP